MLFCKYIYSFFKLCNIHSMEHFIRVVRLGALTLLTLALTAMGTTLAAETYDPPQMRISGDTDSYELSITPENIYYRDMGDTSGYYSTNLHVLFSQTNTTQVISPWTNPTVMNCTIPIAQIPSAADITGGKTTSSVNSDLCDFTVWSTYDTTNRLPTFHILLRKLGLRNYYVSSRLSDTAGRVSEASMFLRLGVDTATLALPRLSLTEGKKFVLQNVDESTSGLRIATTKTAKAHSRDSFLKRLVSQPDEFNVCDVNFKTSTDPVLPCDFILHGYSFGTDPKMGSIEFSFRTLTPGKNIAVAPISSSGQVGTYSSPFIIPAAQGFATDAYVATHFSYLGNNTLRLQHSPEIQTYEMYIDAPGTTTILPRDINIGLDRGLTTPVKICRIESSELTIGGKITSSNCTKEITKVPNTTDVYTIKITYSDYNLDNYLFGLFPIPKNGFANVFVGPFVKGSVYKDIALTSVPTPETVTPVPTVVPTSPANFTLPEIAWTKDESQLLIKPGKGLAEQKLLFSAPVKNYSTNSFDGLTEKQRGDITCYLSETLTTGAAVELISYLPNEAPRGTCLVNITSQENGQYAIELSEKFMPYRYITIAYTLPNGTKGILSPVMAARSSELLPTLNYADSSTALSLLDFSDKFQVSTEFYNALLTLKELRMMNGYPDGSFRPKNLINRAEFTKILLLSRYTDEEIRRETASQMASPCFKDISPYEWYIPYVCFAQKHGIIEGYTDGTFRPANSITYSEAVKIAVVTNGFEGANTEGMNNLWFTPYETTGRALGIFTQLSFRPYDAITREQASEIIYRVWAAKDYFDNFQ